MSPIDLETAAFLSAAAAAGLITPMATDAFGRTLADVDEQGLRQLADAQLIGYRTKAHAVVDQLLTGQKVSDAP